VSKSSFKNNDLSMCFFFSPILAVKLSPRPGLLLLLFFGGGGGVRFCVRGGHVNTLACLLLVVY